MGTLEKFHPFVGNFGKGAPGNGKDFFLNPLIPIFLYGNLGKVPPVYWELRKSSARLY